jgi:hypothetical protein
VEVVLSGPPAHEHQTDEVTDLLPVIPTVSHDPLLILSPAGLFHQE